MNEVPANADLKLDAPFLLDALRHEQDLLLRLIDANQQCFACDATRLQQALSICLITRRELRDGVITVLDALHGYNEVSTISVACDLELAVCAIEAGKDRRVAEINDWLLDAQDKGFVWLDGTTWELTATGYTHFMPERVDR